MFTRYSPALYQPTLQLLNGDIAMQPQITPRALKMILMIRLIVATLGKSFIEWVFIATVFAITIMLYLEFGGPGIHEKLNSSGMVEIIIGVTYLSFRCAIIREFISANKRKMYHAITWVSIMIASITYLLLGSYFISCLILGSVAMWYQFTVTKYREAEPTTETPR